MKIALLFENCSYENFFLINESASSSIKLDIQLPVIISAQSRKKLVRDYINEIHSELSKIKWLICGSVRVELCWYLEAVERQETDKVGDLDNITKPILDSLTGENGILIDDSQIGSLHSFWISRNESYNHNVLRISIDFNNDSALYKENLHFVQYHNALCLPLNFAKNSFKDLFAAKIVIWGRLMARKSARKINALGSNVDRFLVVSDYDFHRTRLGGYPADKIINTNDLNKLCIAAGVRFSHLLTLWRKTNNSNKGHEKKKTA